MSGLKIVFDRERKVLGWKKFDCKHLHIYIDDLQIQCAKPQTRMMPLHILGFLLLPGYSVDSSSNLPVNPNPSAVPPKPATGPNSYTPEATKGASPNGNQVNVLQPSASSSLKLHFNIDVFITAVLLFIAILWSAQFHTTTFWNNIHRYDRFTLCWFLCSGIGPHSFGLGPVGITG